MGEFPEAAAAAAAATAVGVYELTKQHRSEMRVSQTERRTLPSPNISPARSNPSQFDLLFQALRSAIIPPAKIASSLFVLNETLSIQST